MIADFGLSRVMEEEKFKILTEICGTPGVSRLSMRNVGLFLYTVHGPRNIQKMYAVVRITACDLLILFPAGHGKPVDIWAIGVITYFLLCGYTPFDRDTQQQEMQAILRRDYKFEPGTCHLSISGRSCSPLGVQWSTGRTSRTRHVTL